MEFHGRYTALIIENDPDVNEFISDYIHKELKDPHWDIDFLTDLSNQSESTIKQKLTENSTYIFSTTFNNREQNAKLIKLIGEQEYPKQIYIHYLSGDLFLGLDAALPNSFTPSEYGFDKHTIYGIHTQTKQRADGELFRKTYNFFDTVKYYWNDLNEAYVPERPTCFFNDNLNSIYKYKPIWISRESEVLES